MSVNTACFCIDFLIASPDFLGEQRSVLRSRNFEFLIHVENQHLPADKKCFLPIWIEEPALKDVVVEMFENGKGRKLTMELPAQGLESSLFDHNMPTMGRVSLPLERAVNSWLFRLRSHSEMSVGKFMSDIFSPVTCNGWLIDKTDNFFSTPDYAWGQESQNGVVYANRQISPANMTGKVG